MGEGKAGICGDGTIEPLDRAGVHGQLRLTALYIGVPRGRRRCGQGKCVSVRKHDGWSQSRNFAIDNTIRRGARGSGIAPAGMPRWGFAHRTGFVLPKPSRSTAKVEPRVANDMTASGATSPAASVDGYRSATTRPPPGEMA